MKIHRPIYLRPEFWAIIVCSTASLEKTWGQQSDEGDPLVQGAMEDVPIRDKKEVDHGISFYATYTFDYFNNVSGGLATGDASVGVADVGIELDLEKLFGLERTTFVVSALSGNGENISDDITGDFGVVSNVFDDNEFNIYNIFLRHEFGEGESYWRAGQIAADDEFMGAEAAGLFINSTFGAFNTLSGNTGTPVFPFTAPGIVINISPADRWNLLVGAFAGVLDDESGTNLGFNWRVGGGAGEVFIAEAGVAYGDRGSRFKLGGFYHTGEFDNFSDGTNERGLGAVYAIVDHRITDNINAFARGSMILQETRAIAETTLDGGIAFNNLFVEEDSLGFGISYTAFGNEFLLENPDLTNSETVLEATYQVPIGDHFVLQPDIQYILDPNTNGNDALAVGIRAAISF